MDLITRAQKGFRTTIGGSIPTIIVPVTSAIIALFNMPNPSLWSGLITATAIAISTGIGIQLGGKTGAAVAEVFNPTPEFGTAASHEEYREQMELRRPNMHEAIRGAAMGGVGAYIAAEALIQRLTM